MKKGSEEPSQQEPGPGSSKPTNDAIPTLHPSIQEYIFKLTEEEWKDFISMIDCQLARNQFVEVCQAVLKVVSSSSMHVILPVFAHMERDLEHSSNTCPRCKSAGSSTSPKMTSPPASQGGMLRVKVSLAALWKTMMAWRPSRASSVANTALHSSMADHPLDSGKHKTSDMSEIDSVAQHGGECCEPASIKGMVDRALSSEGLDGMARHLVDEIQGTLQQSSPAVSPLASDRSTPIPQPPQMLYSYAEGAMEDLLKSLLPFLVAHSAPLPGLRQADSPAPDGVDEVPATAENMDTASSHSKDQSAGTASCEPDLTQQDCRRRSMISFFNNLMVHQLMVMLQEDAAAAQQERSNDQKGMHEDLIDKVLSKLGGASGAPNIHEHLTNVKIQTIHRIMDAFLLKEFGSKAIQQSAVNPEDGFENIFLTKLRGLLNRNSTEITDVPPFALRASSSIGPVHASAGDKKQKAGRFSRFRLKAPRRRSTKVSPISGNCDMGKHAETPVPTENISDAPADGPKSGKRSWFMRMFSCCLQSPTQA